MSEFSFYWLRSFVTWRNVVI